MVARNIQQYFGDDHRWLDRRGQAFRELKAVSA
jgi:hypothetical protein